MKRRALILTTKLAASALLLAWVARRIDWASLAQGFDRLAAEEWAALYLLQCLMVSLLAVRFGVLGRLPTGFALATTFKAQFFQLAAPSQLGGDAYRAWALVRHRDSGKTRAALLILADRLVGMVTLVIYGLALVTLAGLGAKLRTIASGHGTSVVMIGMLFSALAVLAAVGWRFRRNPRMALVAGEVRQALGQASARQLGLAAVLSLAMYALTTVMAVTIMLQLPESNYLAALTVPPVVLLSTLAFPLSINGIGVREAAGIILYGVYGFDPATSILLVTAPFLASLAVSATGFAWWAAGRSKAVS